MSRTSTYRLSCCRSIRPRVPRMTSRGRCSQRSTRSRRTSARTSTSPRPAPSAGCSSFRARGRSTTSPRAIRAPRIPITPPTRSSPLPSTSTPPEQRTNLPAAIYAYNHSAAYVQSVMLRAELLAGVPSTLVDSVSSLAEGSFPIELRYHPRYTSLATSARPAKSGRSGNPNAPAPAAIAAAFESKALGHAPRSTKIFAARQLPRWPCRQERSSRSATASDSAPSCVSRTPSATPTRMATSRALPRIASLRGHRAPPPRARWRRSASSRAALPPRPPRAPVSRGRPGAPRSRRQSLPARRAQAPLRVHQRQTADSSSRAAAAPTR